MGNNVSFYEKEYGDKDIIIDPRRNKIYIKNGNHVEEKNCFLSLSDIRNQMLKIGYRCPYNHYTYSTYRDDNLENSSIPFFNYVFYYLFAKNLKIPTMNEIVHEYIGRYCIRAGNYKYRIKEEYIKNNSFTFTKEALIGRVFRAYYSFFREIDLLWSINQYSDIHAKYRFQADLDGIDLIVFTRTQNKYCLATYWSSNRSKEFKKKKNENRHDYSKYNMIDVVLERGVNDYDMRGISIYNKNTIEDLHKMFK